MGKSASLANIGSVADAPFTFRNRLINGNGVIGQRGTVTLSGAAVSYGADRWLAGISGGSSVTASTLKSSLGGTSSGTGVFITGTFTTGNPYFAQRIEAANVVDMNSKTVTLSGLVYQDTGSSQNFVPRLTKANALDNWSASTTVATGTAFAVPSGVVTPFEVQFTLGSTDATNGLMVEVYAASAITVTSKNFAISDMQLEIGSRKTPFEVRPIGVELMMCQRYFEKSYRQDITPGTNNGAGCAFIYVQTSTSQFTNGGTHCSFKTVKRTTPTINLFSSTGVSGSISDDNANITRLGAADNIGDSGFRTYLASTMPAAPAINFIWQWTASAEL